MSEETFVETMEAQDAGTVTTAEAADKYADSWDSDGWTEDAKTVAETDGNEVGADQPTTEETDETGREGPGEAEQETGEPAAEAEDQRITLKHLEETRTLNLADPADKQEAAALMQKGLDYDRKTGVLNGKIEEYESFLTELAGGRPIGQFMDLARARMLAAAEQAAGRELSESEALLRVQAERENKAKTRRESEEANRQQQAQDAEAKSRKSIHDFMAAYPGIKAEDIPAEVWAEAKKAGGDLLGAYTRHENRKLKAELSALKQTEKNRERSTGSRRTEGAAAAKDPFDAAWDSF